MKVTQEINIYQFRDMFRDAVRPDQFSYEGQEALFNWLEEYYDDSGESWDGDIIALCCEFAEDTWQNIAANYRIDFSDCETDEEKRDAVLSYLEDHTMVVGDGEEKDGSATIVYRIF